MASSSDIPRSIRFTRICSTVVMMLAPPGEPMASHGAPPRSTRMLTYMHERIPGSQLEILPGLTGNQVLSRNSAASVRNGEIETKSTPAALVSLSVVFAARITASL